jgi:hypothetical protein
MVDARLLDLARTALQELQNQLFGRVEVTSQKLALRSFEPEAERQLVLAAPVLFVQQRHAGGKIRGRRRIGRRLLGSSSSTQFDSRHL